MNKEFSENSDLQENFNTRRKFLTSIGSFFVASTFSRKIQALVPENFEEKIAKLPMASVDKYQVGPPFPRVKINHLIAGPLRIGSNGILLKKGGKIYLLSARHSLEGYVDESISVFCRDIAITPIQDLRKHGLDPSVGKADEILEYKGVLRTSAKEMDGERVNVVGMIGNTTYVIRGKVGYIEEFPPYINLPRGSCSDYGRNKIVMKIPLGNVGGLSGSSVVADQNSNLIGVVSSALKLKAGGSLLILTRPEDFNFLLDKI